MCCLTFWRRKLDETLQAKVILALEKLAYGQSLNTKKLQDGLSEIKIHAGGGLRIYYAEDGEDIVLLFGGGAKDSQSRDIENAQSRLKDYLTRKEQGDG